MSEHSTKPSTVDDEIDLSFIFKGIGNFFKSIIKNILLIFVFFYKHKFVLLILLVAGLVVGYFWESNKKDVYQNNFIILTGYGSADYLYNKVEALNRKIELKDSIFLKSIFDKEYEDIDRIEIEPINNIYNFISEEQSNTKVFELLSEDEDMEEFILKPVNGRNYPYHTLNIYVKGENIHENICEDLFNHINNNVYFKKAKEVELENAIIQIEQNKESIQQINNLIESASKRANSENTKGLVSIEDNNVLDLLLRRKRELLFAEKDLKKQLANQQNIVEIVDANYKLNFDKTLLKKDKKIILPFLFIILYSLIFLVKSIVVKSREFLNQ
jgi:hypothetical protein